MKILIIIDSLGSGGAERSTEVMADYLFENNVNFEILCLDHREIGVQQKMQNKGYNIKFLKIGSFLSQTSQIAKIITSGNFDLVHSILFRSNIRTRFAKLKTKFVHLESLVNTTYSKERFSDAKVNQTVLKFYKKLDTYSSKWGVDHFHSITNAVKSHYVEKVGYDSEKITIIPRGRKPILDDYEDRPVRPNSEVVQIINVGRHEFQKGQIFLLKAAKKLKDHGLSFIIRIYGREGSVTSELKNYIKENSLEEVVLLMGYHNNIPELLLNSDIFVFPSLYEGLGGALIEAQSAGLPIACNDIPVFHEVVRKNQNANLFNSRDTETIVDAIGELIENAELRKSYGIKSLLHYNEKFQEEANNKKMLDLYKRLV